MMHINSTKRDEKAHLQYRRELLHCRRKQHCRRNELVRKECNHRNRSLFQKYPKPFPTTDINQIGEDSPA